MYIIENQMNLSSYMYAYVCRFIDVEDMYFLSKASLVTCLIRSVSNLLMSVGLLENAHCSYLHHFNLRM